MTLYHTSDENRTPLTVDIMEIYQPTTPYESKTNQVQVTGTVPFPDDKHFNFFSNELESPNRTIPIKNTKLTEAQIKQRNEFAKKIFCSPF